MPCGHGMTGNNTEKLVDRGSCPLSKRYFDQKYHKFYSKGRRGPTPVLRNSEERIKELVRGDTLSNCQISGRSKNLEDLNLPDLHPASWYSVAWYPIYRIPDGNFRAAFLTYHSLGHFVRAVSRTPGGVARLVSPVVGLQSYNAKGECWFRPRSSKSRLAETGAAAAMSSDPSEILKERLRTLERTASVMATASVRKGGLRSVNRQPDYEFFVSRGR